MIDRCPSLGDLVAASDGGFSPSHKAAMTSHLRQCGPCRDRLQQANAFLEASADVDDDESGAAGQSLVSGSLADASQASGNVVSFRGKTERVGNARAAMPVSFEDAIGADRDNHAKAAAAQREFAAAAPQAEAGSDSPADGDDRVGAPVAAGRGADSAADRRSGVVAHADGRARRGAVDARLESRAQSAPESRGDAEHPVDRRAVPAFTTVATSGACPAMPPRDADSTTIRHVVGGVVRDAGPDRCGRAASVRRWPRCCRVMAST